MKEESIFLIEHGFLFTVISYFIPISVSLAIQVHERIDRTEIRPPLFISEFFVQRLLQASGGSSNQSNVLILQETSNDAYGSLLVSAAVDMSSMNVVMNGGDSSCVTILPSGFAIVPDCFPDSTGPNETVGKESSCHGGSLLTVGFQIMVSDLPAAKLTVESVETVNNLITRTIQGIKEALHCN